jgi:hypothetical protein
VPWHWGLLGVIPWTDPKGAIGFGKEYDFSKYSKDWLNYWQKSDIKYFIYGFWGIRGNEVPVPSNFLITLKNV